MIYKQTKLLMSGPKSQTILRMPKYCSKDVFYEVVLGANPRTARTKIDCGDLVNQSLAEE